MNVDGMVTFLVDYNTKQAETNLDGLDNKNKAFASGVKTASKVSAVAIGAITTGVYALTASYDDLGDTATGLNATASGLKSLQVASETYGVTAEDTNAVLAKINKSLLDNETNYNNLGVATRDANGELLSSDQIYAGLIGNLTGMSDAQKLAALDSVGLSKNIETVNKVTGEGSEVFNLYNQNLATNGESIESAVAFSDIFQDTLVLLKQKVIEISTEVLNFAVQNQGLALAIGAVLVVLALLPAIMSIVTAAQWAWNSALLANPITWIVLLIIGLIGTFIWLYNEVDFVTNGVNEFFGYMRDTFVAVTTKMKEEIDSLVAKFWEFYNNNKETIDMLIMIFKLLGEMFFTYFVAQIKFGIEMVIAIFGTMVLYVKAHLEAIIGIAWGFISVLIGIFTGDAQMIKDGFVQIFRSMANLVGGIMNSMIWGAERMLNAIIGGINSAIGLMNKIPGVNINFSVGNLSLPRVPSLAIGTNEVLSDGLANIHKGEAIVPANVVKGGFNASGGIGGQDIVINIDASNSVNPDGFERTIMDNIDYAFGKVKGER